MRRVMRLGLEAVALVAAACDGELPPEPCDNGVGPVLLVCSDGLEAYVTPKGLLSWVVEGATPGECGGEPLRARWECPPPPLYDFCFREMLTGYVQGSSAGDVRKWLARGALIGACPIPPSWPRFDGGGPLPEGGLPPPIGPR